MKNKARLSVNAIITIIIMVLVISLALLFIFKPAIWDWMGNLPGYSVNDSDRVISLPDDYDAEKIEGVCPKGNDVGLIENKKIFLILDYSGEETKYPTGLYWDGEANEAEIKLTIIGIKKDLVVGELKKGEDLIEIYDYVLDPESEFNQKIRFEPKHIELKYLNVLDNSYLLEESNRICRILPLSKFKDAWPGDNLIELNEGVIEKKKSRGLRNTFDYKIDLSPYVDISNYEIGFWNVNVDYLKLGDLPIIGDEIQIWGVGGAWGDDKKFGRIYSDGSVWLNRERLFDSGVRFNPDQGIRFNLKRNFKDPYSETNLRVDYDKLKELIN